MITDLLEAYNVSALVFYNILKYARVCGLVSPWLKYDYNNFVIVQLKVSNWESNLCLGA